MNKKCTDRSRDKTCADWYRLRRCAACLSTALALGACSNDLVPVGATLTLSPQAHSTVIEEWQDEQGNCLFHPDNHVDIPVNLQLTTVDGSPIGEASLDVYVDFAANTYAGLPVLALYDDLNGNGVVDAETELISGVDDDIARVRTDQWTGARMLLLRINLSCAFKGEIVTLAGGSTARASVEVIAGDINRAGQTTGN